jgi:hypothetical protein
MVSSDPEEGQPLLALSSASATKEVGAICIMGTNKKLGKV